MIELPELIVVVGLWGMAEERERKKIERGGRRR